MLLLEDVLGKRQKGGTPGSHSRCGELSRVFQKVWDRKRGRETEDKNGDSG